MSRSLPVAVNQQRTSVAPGRRSISRRGLRPTPCSGDDPNLFLKKTTLVVSL